jgi:hypothetical protein
MLDRLSFKEELDRIVNNKAHHKPAAVLWIAPFSTGGKKTETVKPQTFKEPQEVETSSIKIPYWKTKSKRYIERKYNAGENIQG